jgi:hypothetical protein
MIELIKFIAYPVAIVLIALIAKWTIERHYIKQKQYEEIKKELFKSMEKVINQNNRNTELIIEHDKSIKQINSKIAIGELINE